MTWLEVDRFTMGIRIFYNDIQIDAIPPQSHQGGHWETDYVLENQEIIFLELICMMLQKMVGF